MQQRPRVADVRAQCVAQARATRSQLRAIVDALRPSARTALPGNPPTSSGRQKWS
ncbi:hypothetical protein XAP6164_1210007 [Xanthomonas phaseoli pv. phaseoli]|nr:hypothetical protein XAP6164_1210007 [Xanthomonas phaseoli pv. phaseoli]